MANNLHSILPKRQRGVALVIGLIFLALISLIATVGMRQSITQERMAGGLRQESLARSGAETATRAGERNLYDFLLFSNGTVRGEGDGLGFKFANAADVEAFRNAPLDEWYTSGSAEMDASLLDLSGLASPTAKLAYQPVFVIEKLGMVRAPGSGTGTEGGSSGTANYEGSGGLSGGNNSLFVHRITGRATGGIETVVRTVETTYIIREG